MVVVNIKGQEYHIDDNTYKNITFVKDKVLNNEDLFTGLVDGRHGTGKSTLAAQLAFFFSNGNLTLDNVVFTPFDFLKRLRLAKEGDVIILDEAFDTLNRRTGRGKENMEALSLMQKMRIKKAFIFIVLPFFYDLDKNLILGIADMLFHCYRKDYGNRGQYATYDRSRFKNLWLNCRLNYNYPQRIAPPNYRSRFPRWFPFNDKQYQDKKLKSFMQQQKRDMGKRESKYLEQRNKLVLHYLENGYTQTKVGELIGVKQNTISEIVTKEERKGETKNGQEI